MTTAINLAGPADAERATGLIARYHAELDLPYDDAHRATITEPLLDGSPLGAIWLIGPQRAPLGYVMITFGWSVPLGGMIGWLEEVYIRPSVRNRGIGTEVMHAVAVSLRGAEIKALRVHMKDRSTDAARFCSKVGFATAEDVSLMTDVL